MAGAVIGKLAVWKLQKNNFGNDQSQTIFVFAAAIIAYALPTALGGNGYLSVYFMRYDHGQCPHCPMKRYLVHFFDVLTNVVQVLIFFLLGLLVTPVKSAGSVYTGAADHAFHDIYRKTGIRSLCFWLRLSQR